MMQPCKYCRDKSDVTVQYCLEKSGTFVGSEGRGYCKHCGRTTAWGDPNDAEKRWNDLMSEATHA